MQVVLMCTHQRRIQNASLGPVESKRLISSAVFALTAEARSSQYFTMGRPFSPSLGDLDLPGLPSNKSYVVHGSTRIHDRDRQTHDRRTMNATTPSVTTGRMRCDPI